MPPSQERDPPTPQAAGARRFDHAGGELLAVDDARIYFETSGADPSGAPDIPPLLVLHGGFGSLEDFNAVLPGLDRGRRVIGIDSRGHGRSTLAQEIRTEARLADGRRADNPIVDSPPPLSYQRLQHDVERVLAHLRIDTVDIVGCSDGGTVACRLAALSGLNVRKLVVIGAHWHRDNIEPLRDRFARITGPLWRKRYPASAAAYQRLNPAPDFDRLAAQVFGMWLDSSATGYPGETVADIRCPTLVVRGDDDHMLALADAAALAALIPGAGLLNLPFAGHLAHEDQPELFVTALNAFLRR